MWSIKSDDSAPLLVTGGVAYMGFAAKSNTTGGVTALDPASGTILWTFPFGPVADIGGQLAVDGGLVYVATTNGELFALSAANGTKRYEVTGFGAFGAGSIAAIDGVVFAGLDDKKGTVAAVDPASGKTVWRQSLGPVSFPPDMAAGRRHRIRGNGQRHRPRRPGGQAVRAERQDGPAAVVDAGQRRR